MKRYFIRNIIVLATILLIALVITQVSWVKKAYELEQKQFSHEVTQVLLISLDHLQKAAGDSSIILNPIVQEEPNFFVVRMHVTSDPFFIESVVKMEMKQSSLNEDFIIDIYDCFSDSVVYRQHVKIHLMDEKEPVPDLNWAIDQGHYFSIYFPGHRSELFYQMEFWVFSSIILIVIILFFGFIISQMLKQKRVNEMKTDFINNMTHEFKTPLSTIAISSEALKLPKTWEDRTRLLRYVNIIQSENNRLQDQVEKILQAATIEKEKVSIKTTPIDMHQVLLQITQIFKVNIESKHGRISTQLDASESVVLGDETHLKNIFSNLLDNAIKYSPDVLDIKIITRNIGNKIEIQIIDKGLGIDSANQPFIFDKFYRVPTGNIHNVKGFGIGLNYVRLMVKKHHGKIKLKSHLGKGATFTLTFKHK